jgi:hypothetical protein
MRKQELVQLHALCDAIRSSFEQQQEVPSELFRAYDRDSVPPTAIHRNKQAHEEALHRLLDGLVAVTDVDQPQRETPSRRDG